MSKRVFLETTIFSYLASRPSRDLVVAAHQQFTREWWETRRQNYELYISQVVVREAGAGDPEASRNRMDYLDGLPLLAIEDKAVTWHRSSPGRVLYRPALRMMPSTLPWQP